MRSFANEVIDDSSLVFPRQVAAAGVPALFFFIADWAVAGEPARVVEVEGGRISGALLDAGGTGHPGVPRNPVSGAPRWATYVGGRRSR